MPIWTIGQSGNVWTNLNQVLNAQSANPTENVWWAKAVKTMTVNAISAIQSGSDSAPTKKNTDKPLKTYDWSKKVNEKQMSWSNIDITA